jgi:WD40 repeat protein/serine/threonine protein kinase
MSTDPKRTPDVPKWRPVAVVQRRLFLSCVTLEFRAYRDELATNLAQPGVELRRQEDFVNAGQTTLEKLDDYIRTCDAVIHLVGHATGASPESAEVAAMLARLPDFVAKLGLAELFPSPGLSYTQWEAWLALYYGKPLALYRAADVAQREAGFAPDSQQQQRQQQHWQRLERLGRDRKEFASPTDLVIEVLRALPIMAPGFAENVRCGQFRDRNLLFAVLALQDDILSREAFVRVCTLWAADTDRPIAEVMQQERLLSDADRNLVEARLERKLKARGGDIRQSLAESLGSDARQSMSEALTPELLASLPDRLANLGGLNAEPGKWRYRLTRTHGSGGLGVVSVAEDSALDRSVAVKQLRPERVIDPMAVERFVREARITGRLQHPNIVPVYELGLRPDDQIPFYAMRFVGHRTLLDAIAQHYADKTLSSGEQNIRFRGLLQSFLAVCNAIAFAHDQGVIHRDIKPANIMIGDFGEVILLDWGLGKRLDEAEPTALQPPAATAGNASDAGKSQLGVKLGTPAYMSPEQAVGDVCLHGKHTDIYGLGVTLYEILTGDVPFTGASTDELLEAIQTREFPNPRQRNPSVPAPLAAICRKAMQKQPADRYATANALADDIQHWLADEPVSVFAEPMVARVQRVARKNPGPVSALAATVLVGIIGLTAGLYFVNSEKNQTASALEGKAIALDHESLARKHEAEQREKAETANSSLVVANTALREKTADFYFQHGCTEFDAGRLHNGCVELFQAWRLARAGTRGKAGFANVLIDRLSRGGKSLVMRHEMPVTAVAFSPNGTRVLTGSADHTARLWDAATGKTLGEPMRHGGGVNAVAFSPDGTRVLTGSADHTARLWDATTRKPQGEPMRHGGGVNTVAFNPDGKTVLTGSADKTARFWDATTGKPLGEPMRHESAVFAVAFSPDGTRALTASGNAARLWHAGTGEPLGEPMRDADTGMVLAVVFSPDGTRALTASGNAAKLWDATTGKPLGRSMRHASNVFDVAFSPDGTRVLTGSLDKTARLWDAATGKPLGEPMRHLDVVNAVAFSPDGTRVLTGSADHTARFWDATTGKPLGGPLRHDEEVGAVAFSPDGIRVLTGSRDKTARLWDATAGEQLGEQMRHELDVFSVAYSPDGTRVVTGSGDRLARLWDARTGKPLGKPMQHQDVVNAVAFSPDGTRVLTGSDDKTARLWDARTGAPVGERLWHEGGVDAVAFSPDGTRVLTGSRDKTARLWDATTGKPLGETMQHQDIVNAVAFSSDGTRVLTGSDDKTARLWDARTGAPVGERLRHEGGVDAVAFSPDGTRVLTGSGDKTARLWDAATRKPLGEPMRHGGRVDAVAFSPDGGTVLTGSFDKSARLWDAATGKPLAEPMWHADGVYAVAFSPDGTHVLTGSADATARLWDAATGKPLREPLWHGSDVEAVAFSPDGTRVLTGCGDHTAHLWDVALLPQPNDIQSYIVTQLEVAVDDDGNLVELRAGEVANQWKKLEADTHWLEGIAEYWRRRASFDNTEVSRLATENKNWFAAAFHLNYMVKADPDNKELRERLATAEIELVAQRAANGGKLPLPKATSEPEPAAK